MPNDKTDNELEKRISNISCNDRRKRVNKIKVAIVILVIILLVLPTICCIILGLQVSRLQKQVNDLASLHSQYELSYNNFYGEQYAFAAEKENNYFVDNYGHKLTPKTVIESSEGEDGLQNTQQDDLTSESYKNGTTSSTVVDNSTPESEDKNKDDKSTVIKSSNKNGKYVDKKIYLTFDDGPSIYTDDILDILAKYNVKATFFVVGKTDESSKKLYQRIVDEGHTLGMHSYSHQYSKIYNSVEDFDKDFTKLWKLLYDTTGYKPSIFRFPGGSDNMVNKNGMEEFIHYLNKANVVYFDWNVLNGDATGVVYTKEQLISNVIDGIATKENSIVLMHDSQTKKTTVDSLPGLLDVLLSEGAQMLPLNKDVSPIQMIKADTIK